ncbi:MAG TPA: hypothetical protein ENI66_01360, partial [Candidatus Yonathbacteria bacterium]|nr:hypothetical protein [Candidatus Yonathbacteria bacterium]
MNKEPTNNFSNKDLIEAQRALGGERFEKKFAEEEHAYKLVAEEERNKKIQIAKQKRLELRKEELAKENTAWQKKIHHNEAKKIQEPLGGSPVAEKIVAPPKITSLRTFEGDVVKTVRTQKESLTTIALAEQKKRRAQK